MGTRASNHRARRLASTIFGGVGVALLAIGLVAMSLFGFVSSAEATQETVMSVIDEPAVRQMIADEIVSEIEDSGDTPQEKIIFSVARPLIDTAVSRALNTTALQDFIGNIVFTAYDVFVEEKPAQKVELTPLVTAATDAIKKVDKRIAKGFSPKIDPLELERDADAPDLKGIRNNIRNGIWIVILIGGLMEAVAWFISTASPIQKLSRLGIRLLVGGLLIFLAVATARTQTYGVSAEYADAFDSVLNLMSGPANRWGIALLIIGSVLSICCFLKTSSLKKKLSQP